MTEEIIALERAHLEDTVEKVIRESAIADTELTQAQETYDYLRRTGQEEMLPLAELRLDEAAKRALNLRLAISKPYFTRMDFAENGGKTEQFYVGKHGVMDSSTLESYVFDWRAPIAGLYYTGDMGHTSYEAPYGIIEGELTLKRQFEIEDSRLLNVFDTDIVSQDAYLQRALSQMSAEKLQDIVTTIQKEQYEIIRKPLKSSLIIQGAAGSGKTTIALHRIAYLLYAYSDRLSSRNMLILAPNPMFLNYISGVLPDLGVENVNQSTFTRFIRSIFKCLPAKLKSEYFPFSRERGSLETAKLIDAFMDEYERSFIPEKGFSFGPVSLFSAQEFEKFLLRDEAGFPMERRIQEFRKQLKPRVKAAAKRLCEWYEQETARRRLAIEKSALPREERLKKLDQLALGCKARIQEVEQTAVGFDKAALSQLPSCDPVTVYRQFLGEHPELSDGRSELDGRDLAAICLIALRLTEVKLPPLRHIVIDEAQDLAPLEMHLLRLICPEATFTIAGDLMQGISCAGGTENWRDISQGVLGGKCSLLTLSTSYRSTRQIMNEAFRVSRKLGSDDHINVIRDGNEVHHVHFDGEKQRVQIITELLEKLSAEGTTSAAVICRDTKEVRKLSRLLPELRVLDTGADKYESGFCIATAADVKGLEFDACIIADACGYDPEPVSGRLLYVALTRALHNMTVLSSGECHWL